MASIAEGRLSDLAWAAISAIARSVTHPYDSDVQQAAGEQSTADDGSICHLVCDCRLLDPRARHITVCGIDVTDDPWNEGGDADDCVVCTDLEDEPCPRCGE